MEKKLESCNRELGLKIDWNQGAKDKQNAYLVADPGTYKFMRGNIDKIVNDLVDYLKFTEDKTNHKKNKVKTKSGPDAFVEEKRVFTIVRKKITFTFYYTNTSIMLQGSSKVFPEFDNMTPAEWLARKLEKESKDIIKKVDMKGIVDNMKKAINEYQKNENK